MNETGFLLKSYLKTKFPAILLRESPCPLVRPIVSHVFYIARIPWIFGTCPGTFGPILSVQLIHPYLSSLSMVALSVPFPEVKKLDFGQTMTKIGVRPAKIPHGNGLLGALIPALLKNIFQRRVQT